MLFKRLVVGCIALWVFGANAAPVVYTTAQFDTVAAASAGGAADFNSASSPPTALPLTTSATTFNATEFASGSGIAANGLLTTQAEASSLAGVASAVGTSEFTGAFNLNPYTFLQISINMSDLDATDAAAFSSGTLLLLVTVDGTTYLDELLLGDGLHTYKVGPATGGSYKVDLLLSSEANTLTGGNAFNFASVAFDVSAEAPEPSSMLLCGIALIGLIGQQRVSGKLRAGLGRPAT